MINKRYYKKPMEPYGYNVCTFPMYVILQWNSQNKAIKGINSKVTVKISVYLDVSNKES